MKKYLFLVGVIVISACSQLTPKSNSLPAGVTFVEEVKAQPGKVSIPYKKYRLANGLMVLLHQDKSDPLVHVDVTYHVGSAREQLGKSGFAHFFEHMMFQGSKNVADEQHFKIITQSGGDLNGTTNNDRTNYYETVPSNQLEKVLWLESDRMGFLLDAITEEKFEIQRATVKNERGQNVDNRPYGRLDETINQMLYPREHPYSWPVIGYMKDLDRGTVKDLKQFFSRWYGPNNATLTIGGDFDEQQALEWVNLYFGDIKAGPEVKNLAKPLISLDADRYYTIEDNVSLPLVYLAYPTVYGLHQDEAALDVLANILGAGPTSLLYQNLVKSGLAVQAGAGHPCKELACRMNFFALPNPQKGTSLTQLEQVIRDTLAEFEQRGVNDEDLLKTKMSIESGKIYGLQSVSGKVSSLAYYNTFTGDANFANKQLARYEQVTKEDVMRVFRKYIKNKGAAILSVVPKGQTKLAAHANNFTLFDVSNPPETSLSESTIAANVSHFDRSKEPASGKIPQVKVPDFWRKQYSNGLELIFAENTETPTVSLRFSMEGGPLLDPINKAGLAVLTAAMLEEGTKNYSKEGLSNELAKLGSDISVSAGGRTISINVNSLSENFAPTVNLLLDVLFNPKFEKSAFERLKNQTLQGIIQSKRQANTLNAEATREVLYGKKSRLGLPDIGTVSTVSNINLEDVKQFYQQYFSPQHANLVVVGDVDKSALKHQLDYLTSWQGPKYDLPDFGDFPKLVQPKIYFVDLPGAPQSVIKLVRRALPYDATGDYFKATLMNYPLGGAFNSRINLNLREDKGYTYGASSGFLGGKTQGQFAVTASVIKKDTYAAMEEVEKELKLYWEQGLTDEEINFMRQAISQNEALSFETPGQKVGFLRQLLTYNLAKDYGEQQTDIILSISQQALNKIAQQQLSKPMQWIVVGDGQVVKPQLVKLNLPIVDIKLAE